MRAHARAYIADDAHIATYVYISCYMHMHIYLLLGCVVLHFLVTCVVTYVSVFVPCYDVIAFTLCVAPFMCCVARTVRLFCGCR